ncbi:signal peptide peptidase SppA [Novosphingobium sp.]|uniref:signal peptide peptidase SppA n=1 Tax=Novosphingobium sp. TaxID=1874826 RepID=UPI00263952DE|nr:signal peptide peptidase SppA [Novosphingobium sp.]
MKFARSVWKILVTIKDGLVLLLLLLFFAGLYTLLAFRPAPGTVQTGALYLALEGPVVEERARVRPTQLLSGGGRSKAVQERDLVRAIEAAATDERIKAVVLDLENFGGGSQVAMTHVGAAMDRVRAAKKPVLVRARLYTDDSVQIAAHASEAWVDPLGGALVAGPGGTQLYFKALLDRLKVKAHVFKVGTYKSAVEPFTRENASPEAKESLGAVYAALWEAWQADVKKARPKADLALVTGDPVKWIAASGGDAAKAAVAAGLVDRIGDKVAFGKRVGEIVGADPTGGEGAFKGTALATYLADKAPSKDGKAIAVVTVAGDIVDGDAGPGSAGGDRIADLVDKAAASGDYAALVVRVDSPGGSVTGAERIRAAIARMKAKKIPVAVSMGGLAASGGYWVATPADRVFAEPATITGSIGIFAIIPSFEEALAKVGIGTDGVRTTPLSGQPDVFGGFSPTAEAVIQQQIDSGYARFVGLVAEARHKTPAEIDRIAQGRIWDGGTARQLGLVDEFGGIDAALAWAAKAAGAKTWHPVYLGADADPFGALLDQLADSKSGADSAHVVGGQGPASDFAALAAQRQGALAQQLVGDLSRLLGGAGAEVYCLECAELTPPAEPAKTAEASTWLALLSRFAG